MSSYLEDDEPYIFEGPEKRLFVEFKSNSDRPNGMRDVRREQWDELLALVKAAILSTKSNEYFDSYVLSESSLFVYPTQVMIKTCGTTTLLSCLSLLLEYAADLGLELDIVMFSRRNYNNADKQKEPHKTFESENDCLSQYFPKGSSHIMGSLSGEHWHLYVAGPGVESAKQQYLEVMMSDLDPKAMSFYFRTNHPTTVTAVDVTSDSGIASIIPDMETDQHMFDPCGYSMNGHLGPAFSTIHITPEAGFSYVSYETNIQLPNYNAILATILDVFRPGKFTVAITASDDATCGASRDAISKTVDGYQLLNRSILELQNRNATVSCFSRTRE